MRRAASWPELVFVVTQKTHAPERIQNWFVYRRNEVFDEGLSRQIASGDSALIATYGAALHSLRVAQRLACDHFSNIRLPTIGSRNLSCSRNLVCSRRSLRHYNSTISQVRFATDSMRRYRFQTRSLYCPIFREVLYRVWRERVAASLSHHLVLILICSIPVHEGTMELSVSSSLSDHPAQGHLIYVRRFQKGCNSR